MKTTIDHNRKRYQIDLAAAIDISIPLRAAKDNVNAWYLSEPKIEPVTIGDWVGKVSQGASTNFNTITFNPHAHGTHTECVGHITKDPYDINEALQQFFFLAEVITLTPEKEGEDEKITKTSIQTALQNQRPEALVIRTLPNTVEKLKKQYSHTHWPFLTEEAAQYIRELGIVHLLIDLPSVDKEKDQGKLLAHKAFWNYPKAIRYNATITEMIFVNNDIPDGSYVLNLQIAPIVNDASPSKPILYKIL